MDTFQRGRGAYPAHLARAGEGSRVPLHRRGTSQKYECLEDLLREAGFKETRVFTPEAERTEATADGRRRQTNAPKDGNGNGSGSNSTFGIFGLIASLISKNDKEGQKVESQTRSLGRSAGGQNHICLNDEEESSKTANSGSDELGTPTPTHGNPRAPITFGPDLSSSESSSCSSARTPQRSSRSSRLASNVPNYRRSYRTRLDARATLRHMISTPEFLPSRQTSRLTFSRRVTTACQEAGSCQLRLEAGLYAEREAPLPQNWLASVTRVVMGISNVIRSRDGSHLCFDSPCPPSVSQRTVEYGRYDGSLTRRGFAPRTPMADTTQGIVTPASVVCRSAPGSRSSSLARKPSANVRTRRRRGRGQDETCMPCLGITSVQLSSLPEPGTESSDVHERDEIGHTSVDDTYDDSSDEGELDFARLILPARRQHSIQSLRRHLHNDAIGTSASRGGRVPPSAFNRVPRRTGSRTSIVNKLRPRMNVLDDPDDLLHSRHGSSDEDAEDEGLADWAPHNLPGLRDAVCKKRAALPWTSRMQGS